MNLALSARIGVDPVGLIVPALRDRVTALAAVVGAVIALAATPFLPAGLPVLLALAGVAVLAGRRAVPDAREPATVAAKAQAGVQAR